MTRRFEPHKGINEVVVNVAVHESPIVLDEDGLETDDPFVASVLEAHPLVKETTSPEERAEARAEAKESSQAAAEEAAERADKPQSGRRPRSSS